MWYSLVLIFACAGNPSAQAWSPSPQQVICDKGHWGYTDPLLDFQKLSDCNTAGYLVSKQQPHVYVTWRCVADPKKEAWSDQDEQGLHEGALMRWLKGIF